MRLTDPEWLDRLRGGAGRLLVGILVALSASILYLAVQLTHTPLPTLRLPVAGFLICGTIVVFLGFDGLTTRNREVIEAGLSLRRVCRLVVYGTVFLEFAVRLVKPDPMIARLVRMAASDVLMPVGVVTLIVYLRRLCVRLPDRPLARRLRSFTIGFAVWSGISFLARVTLMVVAAHLGGPAGSPITPTRLDVALWLMLILPNAVFAVWAACLLAGFRRAVTAAGC